MATLVFEIWREPDGSHTMEQVRPENDELRSRIAPDAIRVHSFRASTDFEAFRVNNKWQGFAAWVPEPDWKERQFTDEEQRDQDTYLRERSV